MYLEYLILFTDYFKSLNKRNFIYEFVIPFLIGLCIFSLLMFGKTTNATIVFKDNAINLLGILAGFSTAIITILITGSSKSLNEIKKVNTEINIGGKQISLFRLLLINFTYSVITEIFLLIFCLTYPIFLENFEFSKGLKCIAFSTLAFWVIHILFLTIRNLTDFYLTITRDEK